MADPFSIVAVIGTGVKVATCLTKLVKDLHNAPDDLLALSNEVWNLKLVLHDVQELGKGLEEQEKKASPIKLLVFQISAKLDQLDSMTSSWGKLSPFGDKWSMGRRDRFLWMKERTRIAQMRNELRELRSDLLMAIGINVSSTVAKMEVDLKGLLTEFARMYRSDQATPETLSISTLETQEIQSNARDARTMLDGVVNAMNDASRNSDDPYSALRDQDPPGYSRGENPRPYSDNVSERRSGIMGGSAIELVASKAIAAPSLCSATFRRVVSEVSQLFSSSRHGDVVSLRNLFSQKLASPDDVHVTGGWSPLHYAVDHGCVEVCQLLLGQGADPEWEDAKGLSPTNLAWRNILSLRAPPRVADSLAVLFSVDSYLESKRFTRLHCLITGIETGEVEEEAVKSPETINTPDLDGWTPLHWAARRGNFAALRILLAHGADPFLITENDARDSLHLAAIGNSLLRVQHLLQYRKINQVLDINGKDSYGNTPLRNAAGHNSPAAIAYLIKNGADLNATDKNGENALFTTVFENAHEAITQLLTAGIEYTTRTRVGLNTILHFAASEADLETVALLKQARLRGIDSLAKNGDGLTASEIAVGRTGAPEGFVEAFERLAVSTVEDDISETRSIDTATSGKESWKSFEESAWDEAERAAEFDVREGDLLCAEEEAEHEGEQVPEEV